MSERCPRTSIYIGGQIGHPSERKLLAFIVPWLDEKGLPAVVLANVEIDGRQIDCIVATDNFVAVIEAKVTQLPVRGDINGVWTRLSASGEWVDYFNAYQQVVLAKNRVRDAMQAIKSLGAFHPDGFVVFTSALPEGSEVTQGNFKARVTTLGLLPDLLRTSGRSPWTTADWEAFARNLSLTPVTLDLAIGRIEERDARDLLKRYTAAFSSAFGADSGRWLPESEEQRSQLVAAATADAGCFISGPSGCGKSLMARWLATKLTADDHPTFFLAAKNFNGSWADSLRREIALLVDDAPNQLYRAVASSERPAFLVIDGLNELGARAPEALRGVRALARRMNARLIITGQDAKPEEFGGLRGVTIARPSLDLKQRIARSNGGELSSVAHEVLRAVGTGIEASLVGQIGSDLKITATRLLLVDQYIRKRLCEHARAGSFGLRRFASKLYEQVAFSMVETRFDELMNAEGVSFAVCDALFASNILIRRTGRISFTHEVLLNACAAFSLARAAEKDPVGLGQRLSTPILEPISSDIVSAIDDVVIAKTVLSEVVSTSILVDATRGYLGSAATSVALDLLCETTDACVAEIRGARLTLCKKHDAVSVEWESGDCRNWSSAERARLKAIGRRAVLGLGIDVFLRLCAEMDSRLASECRRLAEVARDKKYPIKSQSFALTYYGFGNSIGFTEIARSTQRGFDSFSDQEKLFPFELEKLTSGQLHFFLDGRRMHFDGDDTHFAEQLIYLFRERFRWEPYHVKLVMLSSVGNARHAQKDVLNRLVEAINTLEVSQGNWAISSSVVDALKMLGALDEEGESARSQIKAEIASVLADDKSTENDEIALSLYTRMFDHPFDFIYAEEIHGLDDVLRRRLYRQSLRATGIRDSMSLAWLVGEVASFGDPMDLSLLRSFTGLPNRKNPFVQDEWSAFVTATRFVGRFHGAFEPIEPVTVEERCLTELRLLIYAVEANWVSDVGEVAQIWQRLHQMPAQLVIGCLSEVQQALFERAHHTNQIKAFPPMDLTAVYRADCLAMSRRFIDDGVDAHFYHQVPDKERGISYAFNTVAAYGDQSDIERLRLRTRAHPFARQALACLKRLQVGTTHC
jgi:hypothetical protein